LNFEAESVRLSVTDNGCGFDVEQNNGQNGGSFGLISMRERAEQIGAQLLVESRLGKGTEMVVEVKE
jgi:two-component system sensor histidine kinase DegS